MSISPEDTEKRAKEVRRIYENAEIRILLLIANNLKKGIESPTWATKKLGDVNKIRKQIERELNTANKDIPKIIDNLIEISYKKGAFSVFDDLKKAVDNAEKKKINPNDVEQLRTALKNTDLEPKDLKFLTDGDIDSMLGVNKRAIETLAGATTETITNTKLPIVRQSIDAYRKIVTEVAGNALTGVDTRLEVADKVLARFVDNGIATFVDKSNRTWNIASYTEMATRTAIGQAAIQGHIDQAKEYELDLAMVSEHEEECSLCAEWEGEILSVSGDDNNYSSVDEATADGLFHPNCGHSLQTYIEGLTTPIKKDKDTSARKEREQQRYLERQIRKWKKREIVAMSEKERVKSSNKAKEYNARMKEFIDETGRRRKTNRERVPDVAR